MAERKGLHPLAWVAIGCGVLLVVGAVAATVLMVGAARFAKNKVEDFADQIENRPVETTAKALAMVSPELEFVTADEEARTATFRNAQTGEEVTVDLEDIEQGRVVFSKNGEETTFDVDSERGGVRVSGPDGETVIGGGEARPPAWVPLPPGVTTSSAFTQTSQGRSSGTFAIEGSSSSALLEFYRRELADRGYELSESSFSGGGQSAQTLQGEDSDGHTINVTITEDGTQGRGVVTYEGPSS